MPQPGMPQPKLLETEVSEHDQWDWRDEVLTLTPSEFREGLSRSCAWICKVHVRIESERATRCWLRLGL
jgi:hypothetical protein